ncbi:cytochrome c [Paenibacillus sp. TAF58]
MMLKRAQAAIVGMMLVIAGCGGEPTVAPSTMAPSTSPTAAVTASPIAAATATPAAATVQPAASSTPQPSAAATAKPTAAAATPAVKETATAKPVPTSSVPAPASAAPSPSPSVKPADGGTSTAAQAQVLYKDNCMSCHGAGLAGDFGPNLTKVGSRKTKDEIVAQILGGKGDMPPFKSALKSEEIEVLAAWLADKK